MAKENDKDSVSLDTKVEKQVFVDEFDGMDIDQLLPTMTVNPTELLPPKEECIVSDVQIMGLYDEILQDCRNDSKNVDEVLANFLEMVMNDGDASPATKEGVVNLLKIKSDIADKKTKVADLMTRIKLKDKDTFPRYLAAQQNNKVVIEGSKREMIKNINKLAQPRKKNDQ